MAQTEVDSLEREVRIEAPPETVFAFLTDPDKMKRWFGSDVSLEARPGGVFRVGINERAIASGQFIQVVPHSRVVFTWGWEAEGHPIPPGSSTVEISLEPDGQGTLLRLLHRGLPADALAEHGHGWDHYLARLATTGAGGDPGPDPMAQVPM